MFSSHVSFPNFAMQWGVQVNLIVATLALWLVVNSPSIQVQVMAMGVP
jgi:hypothetical protein